MEPAMRTILALAALVFFACPRPLPPVAMGSDDEQMDHHLAQLEEYRSLGEGSCPDTCALQQKVCDVSAAACALAGKRLERADFQRKCINTQEACASFGDRCARCSP
jgi:hypothetical protein